MERVDRPGRGGAYREIFEGSSESIFLVNATDGSVLEANAACQKLLGYTREELLGLSLEDFAAPVFRGPDGAGEWAYRRKDGSPVDVEVSASAVSYDGVEAVCYVAHDITGRKVHERQLRRSIDSILAIYEASQLLGSTLEPEEIGGRMLGIMQRASDLSTAVISLPDEGGGLRVWRSVGLERLWSRVRYTPEAQEALYEVLGGGEHRILRLGHPLRDSETLSALYLPLRINERTLGVLEVYGSDELEEGEAVEVLVSLSSKAASALENARLYSALTERERLLQELVGRLISARENERRQVAYEVHDGPTQTAVAAYQHLQTFAHLHSDESLQGRQTLDRAVELVRETIDESRQVIADLRPTALDDFGLAAAVRARVEELPEEWEISYSENLGEERLPASLETALYRVVQESLTNVRKHAGSTAVWIELRREEGQVRLLVQDAGGGFDAASLPESGPGERVGVSSMKEQISLFGGELEVRSEPKMGTSVTARVPLGGAAGNGAAGEVAPGA